VIETNPAAGQTVPREATITILVSQGPEPVDVPNLKGMTTSQAEQTLNTLGLLISISSETVEVPISSGLVGNVAEQDPTDGTTVDVGSTVTVKLGAVRQVTVPDVRGKDPATAQNEMTAAGLVLDLVGSTDTSDIAKDDTIATQDPSGGDQVDEGSIVEATVFIYQPVVPDFTGMTIAEAQTSASNVLLGTVSNNTSMDIADPDISKWGTIATQTPAKDSVVPQGTNIEVGLYVAPP
jgi:serine/threonine-protein kinase